MRGGFKPAILLAVSAALLAAWTFANPDAAQAATARLTTVADAHVRADRPLRNYGSRHSLRVGHSPINEAYLRFDLRGVRNVTRAVLRLHAKKRSPHPKIDVRMVGTEAWREHTITFARRPPVGNRVRGARRASTSGWLWIDVTSAVDGGRVVSLALTSSSSDDIVLTSRETERKPKLIVASQPVPPSFALPPSPLSPDPRPVRSSRPAPEAPPVPNPVPPPPPPPPPVDEQPPGDPVIAAAGDVACNPASSAFNGGLGTATACRQRYTSDLLVGQNLAAVLMLGDTQYEDSVFSDFAYSYDLAWGRIKSITYPAVGNHDYHTAGASGYFDYFNGAGNQTGRAGDRSLGYYSFDVGAWHLIALNSNCWAVGGCNAGSPQEVWLRADLAAHPSQCTLAFWHHPRFSAGTYLDNPAFEPLWQALYDHGAEIVLNAHDHNYQRYAPQSPTGIADANGIREFVVGTGGKVHYAVDADAVQNREVANGETYGVLKLTLHAGSYDWRFEPEAGGSFTDTGSASCH